MSNTSPMVHVGIPSVLRNHVRALKLTMSHEHSTTEDNVHKFDISQLNASSNRIDDIINAASDVLNIGRKPLYLFITNNESLNLLRILHKQGRIALEVTFYDIAACDRTLPVTDTPPAIGKKVDIVPNGRLSAWHPSVLDTLGELLDQLLD